MKIKKINIMQFFKKHQIILQILGIILICLGLLLIFSNILGSKNKQLGNANIFSGQAFSGVSQEEQKSISVNEALHTMVEGLTTGQINLLENTYEKDKSIAIAKSLLKQYIATDDFSAAYNLLEKIQQKNQIDNISGDIVSFVRFNYDILHPNTDNIKQELLTSLDKDIYTILYALVEKDYTRFSQLLGESTKNSLSQKSSLIAAFLQDRQTYKTLRDSKSYYFTGLLAVSLMKGGYTPLAMQLSKDILLQDKNYILSYELLSQIAIKERKYQDAVKYLQMLMKLDTQHIPRTAFFLGMAYYYLGDYNSAVTYLNQVRDATYIYDAVRYLILIHNKQGEYANMMDEFRFLLTEKQVEENDYALFFDILFYEPYRKAGTSGDFSLAHQYVISLVVPYIDGCQKELASTAPYICKYGEAGWYLSQNKVQKALKDLLYLSKVYPQSMIFQALGDYYIFQEDTGKANYYYQKALLQDATQ